MIPRMSFVFDRMSTSTGRRALALGMIWACALTTVPAGAEDDLAAPPRAEPVQLGERLLEPDLDLLDVVAMTLENDPNIRLAETTVDAGRGTALVAEGAFDPLLTGSLFDNRLDNAISETASSEVETLSAVLGWQQAFRSGWTVSSELSLLRNGLADPADNSADVSVTFRLPLLRGHGREVVTAAEEAAKLDESAAELDLAHTVAVQIFRVASQYWRVRSAHLNLQILRAAEASSRTMFDNTRKLVEADLTPAAELVLLEADLLSRESNRIAGERDLFDALQTLGALIGLEADDIAGLGLPAGSFPAVDPTASAALDTRRALDRAVAERSDLKADRLRLAAAKLRLNAAENALKPRLDAVLTPSYSGFTTGDDLGDFLTPLGDHIPGLGTTVGLSLSLPWHNHSAEGSRIQADAGVERQSLILESGIKAIGADVPSAVDAVRANARRLDLLERAVELFAKSLSNEEKKLRAGSSTLIDVLTQRDRLTSAQQRRVSVQLALALAILELRFELGALVSRDDEGWRVTLDDLVALPS